MAGGKQRHHRLDRGARTQKHRRIRLDEACRPLGDSPLLLGMPASLLGMAVFVSEHRAALAPARRAPPWTRSSSPASDISIRSRRTVISDTSSREAISCTDADPCSSTIRLIWSCRSALIIAPPRLAIPPMRHRYRISATGARSASSPERSVDRGAPRPPCAPAAQPWSYLLAACAAIIM